MFSMLPLLLDDCILKPDRIDLWKYSLHPVNPKATLYLSAEEQQRASRFYFSHHQRRFSIAHHTLRLILARYLNEDPMNLHFTTGKHGKPELINAPHLQFNLSHSGDTALVAIGKDYPLGVDLEHFSVRPYYGIGEELFSPTENHALKKVPPSLIPITFFNIWAQKEAFIKASGLGLSYPTQQFDVPVLSSKPKVVPDTLHNRSWTLLSFMPQIACCGALCYDNHVREIRYLALSEKSVLGVNTDAPE